jgi:hypothetical protein
LALGLKRFMFPLSGKLISLESPRVNFLSKNPKLKALVRVQPSLCARVVFILIQSLMLNESATCTAVTPKPFLRSFYDCTTN